MHTGLRITIFAAALAATFGTAYGLGSGLGEVAPETGRPASAHERGHDPAQRGQEAAPPGGLHASAGGYTLVLRTPTVAAGRGDSLRFVIVENTAGRAVTAYDREHGKELHLIVASRDLTVFRHLHPVRAADGTWSGPVELPEATGYRVFADFTPRGGAGLTLGADLTATGPKTPARTPAPSRTARVDGYEVTLHGALTPGRPSELRLAVAADGRPVRNLQPYLGAYGHLVALRSGDLAYLHVHPNGEPGDGVTRPGPEISFTATAPSAGTYRLFLDFRHAGVVRTAAFTVTAGSDGAGQGTARPGATAEHGH
ncbi:hypothetical protein ACQEV4_28995 [Streptomyces shenzhenensis]|uniref:hypothetical protein n=1 Tax=Streptomyces shenzhenensis TaxID=943815 RepID=UPI003D8D0FEA